jgi:hypothetical protein
VGLACRLQGMQFAAALMGGGGRGKGGKDSPGKEKPFPPYGIRLLPGASPRSAAPRTACSDFKDSERASDLLNLSSDVDLHPSPQDDEGHQK